MLREHKNIILDSITTASQDFQKRIQLTKEFIRKEKDQILPKDEEIQYQTTNVVVLLSLLK